jgi:hypothetical protein
MLRGVFQRRNNPSGALCSLWFLHSMVCSVDSGDCVGAAATWPSCS